MIRSTVLLVVLCLFPSFAGASASPGPPVNLAPEDRALRHLGYGDVREVPARVTITPAVARLGQRLRYRGVVFVSPATRVRFEPPANDGAFAWSVVHATRGHAGITSGPYAGFDSVGFEADLQIFQTGAVSVPGVSASITPLPKRVDAGRVTLPTVRLVVAPTVTAADSAGELRGLHGPLPAPWWERIPWRLVVLLLLALAAVVLVLRALTRRRPRPAPARPAAPVSAVPVVDAATEALRALAALRAREWPEAGRFGEHVLELTAILRRYLERTLATPRPGDTSGELLERLRMTRMDLDDLRRLEGLLALWDRVKFARAPLTVAEAHRTEEAVEAYILHEQQLRLEAEARARAAAAARATPAAGGPSGPAVRP